ncbi:MAG: hypothetical protein ACM3KR_04575 [Deltaproteobacteria bacterium]
MQIYKTAITAKKTIGNIAAVSTIIFAFSENILFLIVQLTSLQL